MELLTSQIWINNQGVPYSNVYDLFVLFYEKYTCIEDQYLHIHERIFLIIMSVSYFSPRRTC